MAGNKDRNTKDIKDTKEHKHIFRSSSPEKPEGDSLSSSGLDRSNEAEPGTERSGGGRSVTRRLAGDMDRTFQDFGRGLLFGSDMWSGDLGLGQFWMPEVETFRRGDQFVIRADLPGLDKDDVQVEVENHTVRISGERQEDFTEKRDNFYHSERCYGRFQRSIPVPQGIDEDLILASFKDGVLEVTLPVPEDEDRNHGGRRIDIK